MHASFKYVMNIFLMLLVGCSGTMVSVCAFRLCSQEFRLHSIIISPQCHLSAPNSTLSNSASFLQVLWFSPGTLVFFQVLWCSPGTLVFF